jgi:hypothetical protein
MTPTRDPRSASGGGGGRSNGGAHSGRPQDATPDPLPLLERRHGIKPLLRIYLRATEGSAADSAAAWQRLKQRLDRPRAPRRRPTTLLSACAAACLAVWLLGPPRTDDPGTPVGLDAAGGAPGSHAARGGTEGAGGGGERAAAPGS